MQAAADSVGQGSNPYDQDQADWPGTGFSLQGLLANPVVRLAIAAGFLAGMFGALHYGAGSGTPQVRLSGHAVAGGGWRKLPSLLFCCFNCCF